MTLSQIRRIVLVFLAVCIMLLGGLLFMIKNEEDTVAQAGGAEVDIVAFCPKVDNENRIKNELSDNGLQVTTMNVKYGVPTPNGFRLVIRADKSMLDAFRATLQVRHLPSSLIENKTALQYGGVFKTEKEATTKADGVRKTTGVSFNVEQNMKRVEKPCVKFVINGAPKAQADEISGTLAGSGCIDIKVKDLSPEESEEQL